VPAGHLAQLTGLTTGAITGLVDRLEKAGFVHRLADASDRRRTLIEAVDNQAARQTVRQLYEPMSQAFEELTAHYSDAELRIITRYINDSLVMVEQVTAQLQNC
jgi:DNA-binding MarR family transcriptional regulator